MADSVMRGTEPTWKHNKGNSQSCHGVYGMVVLIAVWGHILCGMCYIDRRKRDMKRQEKEVCEEEYKAQNVVMEWEE